jgi:hypothetical protein
LLGASPDDPAVARACLSIVGPLFMLFVADRRIVKRIFRGLELGPADAHKLIQHMVRFSTAGLSATARELQKS